MSRIEKDCLGQMEVPDDVYYGIQTLRVMGVSGILGEKVIKYPYLHRALVQMKKAAALANKEIGALDERRAGLATKYLPANMMTNFRWICSKAAVTPASI